MDQNTRIYVEDERTLSVEQGRVFLDVAKGRQLFRVRTPHGEVTVFGTRFDVQVGADTMRVIVEDGRVQLSSTDGRELFRVLTRDQQGELRRDADAIRVGGVNADRASAWAARIQPETEARELFLTSIAPRYDAEEINAENGWLISTGGKSLESIVLEWEPVNGPGAFTDYVIYVYTPENEPVFRARVNGDVFLDPSSTEIELRNTGQHTRRLNAVFVKAVPTRVADAQSVTFSRVYAVLGQ